MGSTHHHDGQELELLLAGRKPLAAFSVHEDADEDAVFGGQAFASAVARGHLQRFERAFNLDGQSVQVIAFARPDETWRGPAYLQLIKFLYERSWCAHLEWLQGELLGYTSAENAAHLKTKYGEDRLRSGC